MAVADYRLRIGWEGRNAGTFRVGPSTLAPSKLANAIRNPSAELDVSWWVPYTGGGTSTVTRDTTSPVAGAARFKVVNASGTTLGMASPELAFGSDLPAVHVGDSYTFSGYFAATPGFVGKKTRIVLRLQGGANGVKDVTTFVTLTAGMVRWSATTVVDYADRVSAQVYLIQSGTPIVGEGYYADALQLEQAAAAGPYADGDMPGFEWLNGAHVSATMDVRGAGGYDLLGYNFTPAFTNPLDLVCDTTAAPGSRGVLREVSWRRGRAKPDGPVTAGEADLTLYDADGSWNPLDPSSPVYALQSSSSAPRARPMRPVWFEASLDGGATWESQFYLWLTELTYEPIAGSSAGLLHLHAVDFLEWLNGVKPTVAELGATTDGAAIGALLDAPEVDWSPVLRSVDAGDTIPGFAGDGTRGALDLVGELLAVELGAFYQRRDGTVAYESRLAVFDKPVDSTLAALVVATQYGSTLQGVVNEQQVTRQDYAGGPDGVPQFAQGATVGELGHRRGSDITSRYLNTDTQAGYLADHIVNENGEPEPLLYRTELANGDAARLTAMVKRELFDVVQLKSSAAAGAVNYVVQELTGHVLNGGLEHRATWQLATMSSITPFRIGVGTLAPAIDSPGYDRLVL